MLLLSRYYEITSASTKAATLCFRFRLIWLNYAHLKKKIGRKPNFLFLSNFRAASPFCSTCESYFCHRITSNVKGSKSLGFPSRNTDKERKSRLDEEEDDRKNESKLVRGNFFSRAFRLSLFRLSNFATERGALNRWKWSCELAKIKFFAVPWCPRREFVSRSRS